MQSTSVAVGRPTDGTPSPVIAEKRIVPVKWWAAAGAFFCALLAYVMISWLASGPERTPPGPSTIPSWMRLALDIQIYGGLVLAALTIYFFVVRPWRREGRITIDGLIVLAFPTLYWQDTLGSMLVINNIYNSRLPNWGAWDAKIPGWLAPHGERIAEPVVWCVPIYIFALFGLVLFGCFVMRKCQSRWPSLSRLQLMMICCVVMAVLDIPVESLWIRTGVYIYQGVFTPPWLTLFDGKYYQMGLHEPLIFAVMTTLWASARYFKDDKGRTVAERGIDGWNLAEWKKTGVRFLAFSGILNLIFLVTFNIPTIIGSLYLRAWPEDVYSRSYFTNMICGPGTDEACPNEATQWNNRRKPVRFGPDGQLVVPEGTKLPMQHSAGDR